MRLTGEMKIRYNKKGYDLNVLYDVDGRGPDAIIDFFSIRDQSGRFVHLPEAIREDLETEIIIANEADRVDETYERLRERKTK